MKAQAFIRFVVGFVMRWYVLILALAICLAAVSYPRTKAYFANINTDLTELIPEHFNSVKTLHRIRDNFKSIKSMILVVEDSDPDAARRAVDDLVLFMQAFPEVDHVDSKKMGYDFFDKHKLLFVDLDDLKTIRDRIDRRIQREKLGGLYIDFEDEGGGDEFSFGDIDSKYKNKYSTGARSEYYTNDSQTVYSVFVYPMAEPEGVKECGEFYEFVRQKAGEFLSGGGYPGTTIHFTGTIRTRADEYNMIIADLARAGMISGLGIALVLMLYFRRVFAVGMLFVPLSIGIMTTFAFSSLFIEQLNLVTSFLFAVLGGLGVEIGIHLLSRYIEERRSGRDMAESLYNTLYHTGGSALTSAATVAATFWILVINDFKGFSEFGFIAGSGLIINFLSYALVFPSLLIAGEKLKLLRFKRAFGFELRRGGASRFPLPRFVLAGITVLIILALVDLPKLGFEWRFSLIKANIPESRLAKAKQQETASSVNSPAMVVVKNGEEVEAVKAALDERMSRPDTAVHAFRSYQDLVPRDQADKIAVVGEMEELLSDKTLKLVKGEHKEDLDRFREALAETEPVEEAEVPPKVRELFFGQRGNADFQIAYINPLPKMEMDDGRNAMKFAEEIGEIVTPVGTFHPSNDSIVFADVLKTMISDGKRVMVLAFVVVFLIVFVDFRGFKVTALVVSPIALGVLFMTVFMYVLKLKLNFYNIVVAATVVGTSIDNSVHIYHRYREMGPGHLMDALRSSGGAALMSSLTNIFGFLGLVFASHNGLRSIGDLATTGMMACLFTTLVYFPALLQYLEDKGKL